MTDVSETIHKLETMNAGSNVHTINKALCYLKSSSFKTKNILVKRCNKAIATGDWRAVKFALSGLL